ncbi:hypothetical protein PR048_030377 [Dryococelus australis]|uniref:Uncharacterized protein n=1 Tax=Dryococelus australis TaxID=614101 RepID=A0ABQ9G8U0_9NEOP|nr:hypothetical protein PR048_030377 [Dryococelus australis]
MRAWAFITRNKTPAVTDLICTVQRHDVGPVPPPPPTATKVKKRWSDTEHLCTEIRVFARANNYFTKNVQFHITLKGWHEKVQETRVFSKVAEEGHHYQPQRSLLMKTTRHSRGAAANYAEKPRKLDSGLQRKSRCGRRQSTTVVSLRGQQTPWSQYSKQICDPGNGESPSRVQKSLLWGIRINNARLTAPSRRAMFNDTRETSARNAPAPSQEAVSTLASHQGEPGSIPGRVTGFSQVGIVPDDAVKRRAFLGISHFPRPFIPAPLHIHFSTPLFEGGSGSAILDFRNFRHTRAERVKTREYRKDVASLSPTQTTPFPYLVRVAGFEIRIQHFAGYNSTVANELKAVHGKGPACLPSARTSLQRVRNPGLLAKLLNVYACPPSCCNPLVFRFSDVLLGGQALSPRCRHRGNTARHARMSDEALGVRVTVARIAPSLLDLGHGVPMEVHPTKEAFMVAFESPICTRSNTRKLHANSELSGDGALVSRGIGKLAEKRAHSKRWSGGPVLQAALARRGGGVGVRQLASHLGSPCLVTVEVSSPDFRKLRSCRTMPLVGGFSRGLPAALLHNPPRFTFIGSQDLDDTSRPNLTLLHSAHRCYEKRRYLPEGTVASKGRCN